VHASLARATENLATDQMGPIEHRVLTWLPKAEDMLQCGELLPSARVGKYG